MVKLADLIRPSVVLTPSRHIELPRTGDGSNSVASTANTDTGLYRPAESGANAFLFSSNSADENGVPTAATWGVVQFQAPPSVLGNLNNPNNSLLVSDLGGLRVDGNDATYSPTAGSNGLSFNHQATFTGPIETILKLKALSNSSNGSGSAEQPRVIATASFFSGPAPLASLELGNSSSLEAGIILTSGNAIIPDSDVPTATPQTTFTGNVTAGAPVNFTVRYEDASNPIDILTVGSGNLTVKDSGGNEIAVTVPAPPGANASPLDVTYEFTPTTNDTYTIDINPSVKDTSGNPVNSTIGASSFTAQPDPENPTSSIQTTFTGNVPTGSVVSFTVRYEDVTSLVNFQSIGSDNIVVTDPGGNPVTVTVPSPPTASASPLDVTYQFTPATAGAYTIDLANTVADTSGNTLPAAAGVSSFTAIPVFAFTVRTTAPGETFTLPLGTGSGTFNFDVDWGDGSSNTGITSDADPLNVHTYATAGDYQIQVSGTMTYFRFDDAGDKDKVISIDSNGGVGINNFNMRGCSNLVSIPANLFDSDKPTNLNSCFRDCVSLLAIPLIDTSAVTNMNSFCRSCTALASVAAIDTSNVNNFTLAWVSCTSLTSFPVIDMSSENAAFDVWNNCTGLTSFPLLTGTSQITGMQGWWKNCTGLTSFPLIDTSSVTNLDGTWENCTALTSFPLIDTSSVTTFNATWRNCLTLTSFPLIDTSSGQTFNLTWASCSGLTAFPLINTVSATTLTTTWDGCSGLTAFPLINTSNVTDFSNAWDACSGLTSFPLIDTSAALNLSTTWDGCSGLTSFPLIDTSNVTAFNTTWAGCSGLTTFPLIDTSSGLTFVQCWENCNNLPTIPALDLGSATDLTDAFNNMFALSSFEATGMAVTMSVQNAVLPGPALDIIYNNLATVAGQTITVTGNPGSGADTPAIATGKGWTHVA